MDHFQDLRSEMILAMERLGIEIEVQHHEVGTAGQAEIDMRFDTLLAMADKLMLYKYVVKSVAVARGVHGDLHAEAALPGQRLRHARATSRSGTAGSRSSIGERLRRAFRHGPLVHRRAAQATPAPSRLRRADHELLQAPGARLRGAGQPGLLAAEPLGGVPDPAVLQEPEGQARRVPLPRSRPAIRTSPSRPCSWPGLDGVQKQIEPPAPVDKDLFDLPPEELAKVRQVPASLDEALEALEDDHDFLNAGGVFTDDLIDTWIEYKRENEIDAVRLRPHPWEFMLYYDI